MSSVTSCWVIIPDGSDYTLDSEEKRVREVADFIRDWIVTENDWPVRYHDKPWPTIDLLRDDWASLQAGSKVAGMAAIWFGWNYADPEKLGDALAEFEAARGAMFIWQHENENKMNARTFE